MASADWGKRLKVCVTRLPTWSASFAITHYDDDGAFNNASRSSLIGIGDPVPEPGSMVLLATGCLGLFGYKLRRRGSA